MKLKAKRKPKQKTWWQKFGLVLIGVGCIAAGTIMWYCFGPKGTAVVQWLMTKGIDSLIHGVVKKLKDINSDWKDWGIGKSVRLAASLVTFGLEKLAIKISQTNNTHLSGTTVYDINQALLEPGSNTNADFVHSQNQTKINKNYDEFLERTKQSFEQCASIFVSFSLTENKWALFYECISL